MDTSTAFITVGKKVYKTYAERELGVGISEEALKEGMSVVVPVWRVYCVGLVKRDRDGKFYVETSVSIVDIHLCTQRECWVSASAKKKHV